MIYAIKEESDLLAHQDTAYRIQSPSIFAPNMDWETTCQTVRDFFLSLRQKELLLTEEEAGLPCRGNEMPKLAARR